MRKGQETRCAGILVGYKKAPPLVREGALSKSGALYPDFQPEVIIQGVARNNLYGPGAVLHLSGQVGQDPGGCDRGHKDSMQAPKNVDNLNGEDTIASCL